MKNYVLGVISGLAGVELYQTAPDLSWYFWALFAISLALIVFSVDVFFGSRVEHQVRAGWVGLGLFGGSGTLLQLWVWSVAL